MRKKSKSIISGNSEQSQVGAAFKLSLRVKRRQQNVKPSEQDLIDLKAVESREGKSLVKAGERKQNSPYFYQMNNPM